LTRTLAALLGPFVLAACGTVNLPPAPGALLPDAPREFILFGDTQKTMTLEFWRPHYDDERRALIRAVADERPAFVVNAGDVVCHGGNTADWKRFCGENRLLFERGIAYFPALGNHDLYGGNSAALGNRARVFPHIGMRRWYSLRYAPVLLVVLDSNFDDLGAAEVRRQDEWLEGTLAEAEKDPAIRHVLLVFHHPPYTNALGIGESREVQEHFVSRLAPKVGVVFSGHVHNYERFEKNGVQYLVSGGGGGPTRELNRDRPAHEDLYRGDRTRPFHYCRFRIEGRTLKCDVLMLEAGGSWSRVDGFERP
jgi:hypothetical protein